MGLLLKQLFNFLKLINSDTGHNQIAAGFVAGLVLGFSPILSIQVFIVFLIIFFFRIQIGAAFVAAFAFKFAAYLFDPIFHFVGKNILETEALVPLFTQMYNMPIIPLTRFNNTVVMGAGVTAFLMAPLAFFIFRSLIIKYRVTVVERIKNTKIMKAIRATSIYQWYHTYDKLYG